MPLVQPCRSPGCSTLTMGELCVEHEPAADEPPLALEPLLEDALSDAALDPVP